jgi:hypothetical protein
MKKSRFSESQIMAILKEVELGPRSVRPAGSTASATPLTTSGRANTLALEN